MDVTLSIHLIRYIRVRVRSHQTRAMAVFALIPHSCLLNADSALETVGPALNIESEAVMHLIKDLEARQNGKSHIKDFNQDWRSLRILYYDYELPFSRSFTSFVTTSFTVDALLRLSSLLLFFGDVESGLRDSGGKRKSLLNDFDRLESRGIEDRLLELPTRCKVSCWYFIYS